jgi:hypothetical protein
MTITVPAATLDAPPVFFLEEYAQASRIRSFGDPANGGTACHDNNDNDYIVRNHQDTKVSYDETLH